MKAHFLETENVYVYNKYFINNFFCLKSLINFSLIFLQVKFQELILILNLH